MSNKVFDSTVNILKRMARFSNMTYRQVNVLIWLGVLPFVWAVLIDNLFDFHYVKVSVLFFQFGFLISVRNYKRKANDIFNKCAMFLLSFSRYGMGYVMSSIVFCLVIPAAFTVLLLILNL